ncbi:tetraacyldisaccharide 4'-kinase [Canicola haemoglobinophilus]|uniref:Tetraacyldisaccharide 4'-kinase n=1 Tax=Canicola haemoglobinophilus TaxID=733 RepID=A0A1V4B013_9PAST|nr:tetraacyldisaccharide 4'-kinase [Canicola haemoglobinophilus]OOR99380.1 tetraacyldisaccharide 4'-kinase [Canicola haemoglobinophilus]STO60998.1 tetraacyldisaccharide 4'-kinase [Canicola haemoglobinophilus]
MSFWYENHVIAKLLAWLLFPLSLAFWFISFIRRSLYRLNLLKSYRPSVPVLIVGNLSVGGNGKTPVTIWLVQQFQQQGIKCGVISRGYGSRAEQYPYLVKTDDNPTISGDEPLLIAQRTGAPVCISPNRQQAIELLLAQFDCDLIISDDGLQHYKLQRDFEIVVIDGERIFGNGFVMPSGPLRELPSRLEEVDLIINNGKSTAYSNTLMRLVPKFAVNLLSGERKLLTEFQSIPLNAIAGIGYPQRFFKMLQDLALSLETTQGFQDHQDFNATHFAKFPQNQPLFMTEKDAVKCRPFAQKNWWYVPVEADIQGENVAPFMQAVLQKIKEKK